MFDLQVLAYRTEITRISTLLLARENSNAFYPGSGVREGFHNASHHSNERKNMDQFAVINRYHVKPLTYFLDKLRSTPDGDGTLLDHSMILYGSSLSDGNEHNFDPLPVLLAGGASGQLQGGRHLRYPPHTPMANLLLAMLHKLGAPVDSIGDSTEPLASEPRPALRSGAQCAAVKPFTVFLRGFPHAAFASVGEAHDDSATEESARRARGGGRGLDRRLVRDPGVQRLRRALARRARRQRHRHDGPQAPPLAAEDQRATREARRSRPRQRRSVGPAVRLFAGCRREPGAAAQGRRARAAQQRLRSL